MHGDHLRAAAPRAGLGQPLPQASRRGIATAPPHAYLEKYQATFAELPHVTELYVDDRAEAGRDETVEMLKDVNAIFFSGGDQLRITSKIGDTRIYERVHEIYRCGGLVAGTSAGASAMSKTMLVRGRSAASFRIGDLHMAPGLGLLPNVIIETKEKTSA